MKIRSALVLLACLSAPYAFSEESTILSISGKIAKTNSANGAYTFKLDELQKLPSTTVNTKTPWSGTASYKGTLVRDLLSFVGASKDAKFVLVNSLDNYRVTIPIEDFSKWRVILAYSKNGKDIPVSDKGPLWLIYPISESPDADSNATASKMVWALTTLKVK